MRFGMQLGWGVGVSWLREGMQGQHSTFWDSQEQAWVLRGKQWQVGVDGWMEQGVKVLRRSRIWNLKGIWTRERRRHPKKVSQCEWLTSQLRGELFASVHREQKYPLFCSRDHLILWTWVLPLHSYLVSAHLWSKSCWLARFPCDQPVHQPQTQLP